MLRDWEKLERQGGKGGSQEAGEQGAGSKGELEIRVNFWLLNTLSSFPPAPCPRPLCLFGKVITICVLTFCAIEITSKE